MVKITCNYCKFSAAKDEWKAFCGIGIPRESWVSICPHCELNSYGISHKNKEPGQVVKEILDFISNLEIDRLINHNED